MRIHRLALAGALLLHPAVAAADEPPPIPYAPAPMPAPPPPRPYTPKLRYQRHSTALMVGGIVLTAIGGLSILGGVTAIVEDQGNHGDFQGFLSLLVGLPLIVHGGGCIAGGIPMWRIGARDIPAGWAAASPSISLGPTSSLRWTF